MTKRLSGGRPVAGKRQTPPQLVILVNTDFFFLTHRLPLALRAKEAGYEVTVAAADTGRASEIKAYDLRFTALPMSRSGRNPAKELRSAVVIWRYLRRARADVIHLVATKAIIYGGLFAICSPRPAVVYAVTGSGFALGEGAPALQKRALLTFMRLLLRRSRSATIFQNTSDLREFWRGPSSDRRFAAVIPGAGVDLDRWKVFDEPSDDVVLFASRLFDEKGVRTFVRAAEEARTERPHIRWQIAGEPDDGLPTSVPRSELAQWHAAGIIEWLGGRNDMDVVLGGCKVFALPTYHREGVPKVLLEAGAARRPSVVSNVAGCREIVCSGPGGVLIEPRSPEQLKTAVYRLLDDRELRLALGRSARAVVVQRHHARAVAEETLQIYERLEATTACAG